MKKLTIILAIVLILTNVQALTGNLNTPSGGENWLQGTTQQIKFNFNTQTDYNSPITAKLYYSKTKGADTNSIVDINVTNKQFQNSETYLIDGWHFNDTNKSSIGNLGTTTADGGTGLLYTFKEGLIGNAIDFNKTSEGVMYTVPDFNGWAGTVSFWFKRNPEDDQDGYETYFRSGAQTGAGIKINKYYNQQNDLQLCSSWAYTCSTMCDNTTAWNSLDNKWHHIVATWDLNHAYDGNTLTLWIDGQMICSTTATEVATEQPKNVRFGGDPTASNQTRGRMDEVQIFSRPLTATQIRNKYLDMNGIQTYCPNYDKNCTYNWTLPTSGDLNNLWLDLNLVNGTTYYNTTALGLINPDWTGTTTYTATVWTKTSHVPEPFATITMQHNVSGTWITTETVTTDAKAQATVHLTLGDSYRYKIQKQDGTWVSFDGSEYQTQNIVSTMTQLLIEIPLTATINGNIKVEILGNTPQYTYTSRTGYIRITNTKQNPNTLIKYQINSNAPTLTTTYSQIYDFSWDMNNLDYNYNIKIYDQSIIPNKLYADLNFYYQAPNTISGISLNFTTANEDEKRILFLFLFFGIIMISTIANFYLDKGLEVFMFGTIILGIIVGSLVSLVIGLTGAIWIAGRFVQRLRQD